MHCRLSSSFWSWLSSRWCNSRAAALFFLSLLLQCIVQQLKFIPWARCCFPLWLLLCGICFYSSLSLSNGLKEEEEEDDEEEEEGSSSSSNKTSERNWQFILIAISAVRPRFLSPASSSSSSSSSSFQVTIVFMWRAEKVHTEKVFSCARTHCGHAQWLRLTLNDFFPFENRQSQLQADRLCTSSFFFIFKCSLLCVKYTLWFAEQHSNCLPPTSSNPTN